MSSVSSNSTEYHRTSSARTANAWKSLWGVSQNPTETRIPFPVSLDELAKSICATIREELLPREKSDASRYDPHVLHNVLHGDTILHRRPSRSHENDRQRMGIEVEGEDMTLVALKTAHELCRSEEEVAVAIYFSSLKEALIASKVFQLLQSRYVTDTNETSACDRIEINVLHRTSGLPNRLLQRQKETARKRKNKQQQRPNNTNQPERRGYVIIVQPVGMLLEGLQRIVARATLHSLPVILLSPRMNHFTLTPWDQSGFQQSAYYGGSEPPRGPTPWLMRDFTPPILSWIRTTDFCLWQTIRHRNHCWDIFARTRGDFLYLASTQKAAGRPTAWLVDRLFEVVSVSEDE